MVVITENWKKSFPQAHLGILAMRGVRGPERHAELDRLKKELEDDLRNVFKDPAALKSLEPVRAYQAYYKRFKKTYHVVHQLESVAIKGKPIPRVSALVEAMFMGELRNALLTAGHDLDAVTLPLTLDVTDGSETYIRMNGQEQVLKAGDMMISDAHGVISSVIYGPDQRTMIGRETENVLFTVYGVPGISEQAIRQHLEGIAVNVTVVCPEAKIERLEIYSA
jgi:DNA/RNA-binding domain of Phe-tRNA-synthetase-like protein